MHKLIPMSIVYLHTHTRPVVPRLRQNPSKIGSDIPPCSSWKIVVTVGPLSSVLCQPPTFSTSQSANTWRGWSMSTWHLTCSLVLYKDLQRVDSGKSLLPWENSAQFSLEFRSLTWVSEFLWPVPHRCLGFPSLFFSISGEDIHWESKAKIELKQSKTQIKKRLKTYFQMFFYFGWEPKQKTLWSHKEK